MEVKFTASVLWWSEFLATDTEVGFDSRRYQIFWEVVGLERDPLSTNLYKLVQYKLGATWKKK
jgi:hypothetical protein